MRSYVIAVERARQEESGRATGPVPNWEFRRMAAANVLGPRLASQRADANLGHPAFLDRSELSAPKVNRQLNSAVKNLSNNSTMQSWASPREGCPCSA